MARLRHHAQDAIFGLSAWLCRVADRIDPGPNGEPCPDCRVPISPPLGPDDECPACREAAERNLIEAQISASAYGAGYEAAVRTAERGEVW